MADDEENTLDSGSESSFSLTGKDGSEESEAEEFNLNCSFTGAIIGFWLTPVHWGSILAPVAGNLPTSEPRLPFTCICPVKAVREKDVSIR